MLLLKSGHKSGPWIFKENSPLFFESSSCFDRDVLQTRFPGTPVMQYLGLSSFLEDGTAKAMHPCVCVVAGLGQQGEGSPPVPVLRAQWSPVP